MSNNMNVDELSNNKEKAIIYKKEEELAFDNIVEVLENINYNYSSNNSKKLDNKINDLISKLSKIKKIHNNNILVIEKNINKYKSTAKETEKIFDDLMNR